MNGYNSFTNLNDLKDWFFSLPELHYYTLYGEGKKRIESQTFVDRGEGWEVISRRVMALTGNFGGNITIYVGKTEKDTNGFTVVFNSPMYGNAAAVNQAPGIGAPEIQSTIQAEIKKALDDYKKDQEIENLKAEIVEIKRGKRNKGINGVFSEIGETLEENPTLASMLAPFISGLAAKFFNTPTGDMNYAMTGPPARKIVHQTVEEAESDQINASETIEEEYTEEEIERIMISLNKLSQVFDDPIDLLEKFSNFAEKNPTIAKNLLSQLPS